MKPQSQLAQDEISELTLTEPDVKAIANRVPQKIKAVRHILRASREESPVAAYLVKADPALAPLNLDILHSRFACGEAPKSANRQKY